MHPKAKKQQKYISNLKIRQAYIQKFVMIISQFFFEVKISWEGEKKNRKKKFKLHYLSCRSKKKILAAFFVLIKQSIIIQR